MRELVFLEMWAGGRARASTTSSSTYTARSSPLVRLASRASARSEHRLLRCFRAPAGPAKLDDGYGFPSSHSQWMGNFASFLALHFAPHHRFVSTSFRLLDVGHDVFLYTFIVV